MAEWRDTGIILRARRHGEAHAIVSLLTASHGRQAGLVRGGMSRTQRAGLEPGSIVMARWHARLDDQLGSLTCEPLELAAADLLDDPLRLLALSSACALLESTLAERTPVTDLYDATLALLAALRDGAAPLVYIQWELALLAGLGYGLDLQRCAVSGEGSGLCYVSPRTGRAVSATAGAPYHDRLLPLPLFLRPEGGNLPPTPAMMADALRLTGHFLQRHALLPGWKALPESRQRLLERLMSDNDGQSLSSFRKGVGED